MLTFFFSQHLNPRTNLLEHNCFKYDCNASFQNISFFRINHTWFFPPRQIVLFVLLLFTAFLNVKNLELRTSFSVTAFRLLRGADKVTKKIHKPRVNAPWVTFNSMQKSNIALKEPEGVLVLCSSGQAEAQAHSPASRGRTKNPSSLNNRASCQGIATVLLVRPGTSIPALFRKNDIKEISKTLHFRFHEVTASTGINSLPPSSFCSWPRFLQTCSGSYVLSNILRHI